jgi:hypothetical protein
VDFETSSRFHPRMRFKVHSLVGGLVAGTLLATSGPALAAGGSVVAADNAAFAAGKRAPITIKGTQAGAGVRKGAKVPRNATIKVRWLTQDVVAGSETSLNVKAPSGQAIVAATSQLVAPKGKVLATWFGTFGQGPVLIDGQFKGDAGILVSVPETLKVPKGSVVVTYALFRKGGKSHVTG